MKNTLVMLVGLIVLGVSVAAMAAPSEAGNTAALYLKNCSICHGDQGDANTRAQSGMLPRPRDFTTAEAAIELTRERMIDAVSNGRPGTAMVAHKGRLSPEQIAALVDYVRANFMQVPLAAAGQPEAVSLGEKTYVKNCSVCHGDGGRSAYWAQSGLNPPPRDFTSTESLNTLSRERMLASVSNGRPGTGMMPFNTRLSDAEIDAVVAYIRFKFMGVDPDADSGAAPLSVPMPMAAAASQPAGGVIPGVDAPLSLVRPVPASQTSSAVAPEATAGHRIDVDMSLPVPRGLQGDLEWAHTFYLANCAACHGVTGVGDGPRAYFNIPPPRNFTSKEARQVLNRPRIFDSITDGRVRTVMPAWGKVLTEQQIAGLTEFVFQQFIQPPVVTDNSKKKVP